MKETVCIYKEIEHAIINAFYANPGQMLSAGQIKAFVKNYIDERDQNIQKRLERMVTKNWLRSEKLSEKKALYCLNPEIEFSFEGINIKPKIGPGEPVTSERIRHTSDLKDAIRTWIYDFSEPCQEHSLAGGKSSSDVIASCENHVLFLDIANHLPKLGSKVCSDWDSYKRELEELDKRKDTLLSYIEDEIRKCFQGMKLAFVYDNDEDRYYECYLIQNILYNITLEAGQEGYDEHMSELISLRDIPIREYNDYCFWGEYLTVPAKYLELLKEGVARFLVLFENSVDAPEFRDIVVKVNSLKTKRNDILRELDRLLKYTSFPGECEYLNRF